MSWDEALGVLRRDGRGEPPLRHVLVPPHRPDADQAQHPARRRRLRGRAGLARAAAGSTTSSCPTPSSASLTAGANRVPGVIPRMNQVSARVLSPRTYSDVAHRVFTSPRRVVFREMEYAVPREAGLDALREARTRHRGVRLADQLPGRDPGRARPTTSRCRRRPAGTPSTSPSTPTTAPTGAPTRRTSRRWSGSCATTTAARTGASCTRRTAADLAPAYPRFGDFLALRDRLDPDRVFANDYLRPGARGLTTASTGAPAGAGRAVAGNRAGGVALA